MLAFTEHGHIYISSLCTMYINECTICTVCTYNNNNMYTHYVHITIITYIHDVAMYIYNICIRYVRLIYYFKINSIMYNLYMLFKSQTPGIFSISLCQSMLLDK